MSEETVSRKSMITVKRADGENIYGEFGWIADDDENLASDYDGADEPIEYVREVWELVSSETFWGKPQVYGCEYEDDESCDEDAVEWTHIDGSWLQACARHVNGSNLTP